MCIRDRNESVEDGFVSGATQEKKEVTSSYRVGFVHGSDRVKGNALDVLKYSVYAVSYTHLDVYKRQELIMPR